MKKEEGNRVIALFMGYKKHNHGSYITWEDEKGNHIFDSVLQYDTKFDGWLLPVIEKIEAIKTKSINSFRVTLGKSHCLIECFEAGKQPGVIYETPFGEKPSSRIEAAWLAVIEFINWYEKNKQL